MTDSTLRLRGLRADDDAALTVLFADPETGRWNPGPGTTDIARWRTESSEIADDFRTWTVTDDSDGFLGVASLFSIDPVTRTAEIGFRTLPAARGRGVARAAVDLACAWAREHTNVREVVLFHAVDNTASCRVATSCDFELAELLPANHRYGDGELHDEHRHVRQLAD